MQTRPVALITRVTEKMREAVAKRAAQEDRSVSAWLRRAIAKALEEEADAG